MKKLLLHLFKRWICFPIALIFWIIGTPLNLTSMLIFEGIYWFITASRSLMNDSFDFLEYSLS
jgi:hypothetical protein